MTLETAIVAALKADATISGIVGSRVYPGHVAQSAGTQAAIWYRVITGLDGINLDGGDGTSRMRIEIGCASQDFSDVVVVTKAAIELFEGFQGTLGGVEIMSIIQDGVHDDFEDGKDGSDVGTHCRAVDFMIREGSA